MYESGLSYFVISLLLSLGFLSNVTGNAVGGIIADRIGRKRSIIVGRVFLPAVFLLLAILPIDYVSIPIFIGGFGLSASMIAREALLGEHLQEKKRGLYYNLLNSLCGLSYGIGAFYAAKFVESEGVIVGFKNACYGAFFIALFAIIALFGIKEKRIKRIRTEGFSLMKELANKKTLLLVTITSIMFLGLAFIWLFISIYAVEALKVSESEWGFITAILWPTNALLSPILGKISDRLSIIANIVIGCTLIISFSILLAFPLYHGWHYLTVLLMIDVTGEGFLWPAFFRTEILLTEEEKRGRVFGIVGSITEIIRAGVSPLIGKIYGLSKRLPYVISTFLFGSLILVYLLLFKVEKLETSKK